MPVKPVGPVLNQHLKPLTNDDQWAKNCLKRCDCAFNRRDKVAVKPGGFGFKAVACILAFGASINLRADGREQGFDRAKRVAFEHTLQPAVGW